MKIIALFIAHMAAVALYLGLIQVARRSQWGASAVWSATIGASVIAAAGLLYISDPSPAFADFRGSYFKASIVFDHPARLAEILGPEIHGFVNLPILVYIFAPLGLLPFNVSITLFSLLGLAAMILSWRLLTEAARLDTLSSALLLFLFALSGPLIYNFKEGNTSQFAFLLLLLAFNAQRSGKSMRSGALLALAGLLKLPLLLFALYFVVRGDLRGVVGGAAVCVSAAVLSFAVFGWDMHILWFDVCIRPYLGLPMSGFNVQSIAGFLARWERGAAGLLDWTPQRLSAIGSALNIIIVLSLYALASFATWRRRRNVPLSGSDLPPTDLSFLIFVMLACVTSPVAWSHYYHWILFPIAFLLGPASPMRDRPWKKPVTVASCLFVSVPVVNQAVWQQPLLHEIFARTGTSLHLFGALIVLGFMLHALWSSDLWRQNPAYR